jgi:dolichyl-diphosphooligosaccharide---protein glycosyltransferase
MVYQFLATREGFIIRRVVAIVLLAAFYIASNSFVKYCWRLQQNLSNPTIIARARRRDNVIIKVDDYREAYWWLRDHTPEDSRVMAWWDCTLLSVFVFYQKCSLSLSLSTR